jgi:hypothetical protein
VCEGCQGIIRTLGALALLSCLFFEVILGFRLDRGFIPF